MHLIKRRALLVPLATAAVLSSMPASGQDKKLDRFLLSNSTISESRLVVYMAEDLGLFQKHGLDPAIVHIRGAGLNVAALVAGEIRMAVAAGTFALVAAARGAPVVIVATTGPTRYELVSTSIASARDLKGKIIGIGGYASGDYFVSRRLLPKLGLAPDRDVSLIPVGSTSSYERMNAMLAGKVDAVLAIQANVERIRARGQRLNVLATTADFGLDGSGGDFLVTRESLRSHAEQLKAALKALSDAIVIGRQNPELFKRTARRVLQEDNAKLLDVFYRNNYFFGAQPHDPRPLQTALEADIKDLSATVPELKGRRASEFIDTTILDALKKEGFFP
jgi:NitT/TauT family transport system substrate-binding protein